MQLQTNSDKREIKSHGSYSLPVFISHEQLSSYERGVFAWHWHPEIELTLVKKGQISYQVNDKNYVLREGQGLFCNSNALHTGHMINGEDCHYLSITFHPRMIYGFENSAIERDLVSPVLRNQGFGSFVFDSDEAVGKQAAAAIREIERADQQREFDYALIIQENLMKIWRVILKQGNAFGDGPTSNADEKELGRIRQVLDFIHSHYQERITLEQVADQMNLCRSESCRFFKKYMKQSVFEYIQNYRIGQSAKLLSEDSLSVTEISYQCGFSSPAYFTKTFRELMNCTPMMYRKQCRERKNE